MNNVKLEIEELLLNGELNDYERSLMERIHKFIEEMQSILKEYKATANFYNEERNNILFSYNCCSSRLSDIYAENKKLIEENDRLRKEIERLNTTEEKNDISFWDYILKGKKK